MLFRSGLSRFPIKKDEGGYSNPRTETARQKRYPKKGRFTRKAFARAVLLRGVSPTLDTSNNEHCTFDASSGTANAIKRPGIILKHRGAEDTEDARICVSVFNSVLSVPLCFQKRLDERI